MYLYFFLDHYFLRPAGVSSVRIVKPKLTGTQRVVLSYGHVTTNGRKGDKHTIGLGSLNRSAEKTDIGNLKSSNLLKSTCFHVRIK